MARAVCPADSAAATAEASGSGGTLVTGWAQTGQVVAGVQLGAERHRPVGGLRLLVRAAGRLQLRVGLLGRRPGCGGGGERRAVPAFDLDERAPYVGQLGRDPVALVVGAQQQAQRVDVPGGIEAAA